MTQLSKEHWCFHIISIQRLLSPDQLSVLPPWSRDLRNGSVPHRYLGLTQPRWAEVSGVLSQPPSSHPALHSSRLFARESGLVSRSWWARWQMGLKRSLSTSVPNCSRRGRNLLRPPDCFWYVLTSLPKVCPCSNYYVNRLIIHVGRLPLWVKATSNSAYSIPCCFRTAAVSLYRRVDAGTENCLQIIVSDS